MPLPQKIENTENTNTIEDYYSLPEEVRAELIDGKFYDLASPSRVHQKLLIELGISIGNYIKKNNGSCEVYPAPFAVQLFPEDDTTLVEPDISVICDKDKLTDRGCTGAPDWVIEIVSPSNRRHDYIKKLALYTEAGVRDYWIVDPEDSSVVVYFLEGDRIKPKMYTFDDTVKANIYDDFSIDFKEIERLL